MTINQLPLTPARWRRLHPAFRVALRQALGSKHAILNREREPTLSRKGTWQAGTIGKLLAQAEG